jgi:phage shock protein PspC (stress-responsive transcriptional regulator)
MNNGKRLARSNNDRIIAGVCGGIARYLNVDPTLIRLGFVLLVIPGGVSPLLYLLLWAVLPSEDSVSSDFSGQLRENISDIGQRAQSLASQAGQQINQFRGDRSREVGAGETQQDRESQGPSTGPTRRL